MTALLEDLGGQLESLEASLGRDSTYEEAVEGLERVSFPLGYAWGVVGHLNGVKNSDALREAHAAMQPKIVEMTQRLGQSRAVYEALDGLSERSDDLAPTQKRVVDASLRSMRLGGVALEGEAKDAYNKNSLRLSELSTTFSNNVLDATKQFELLVEAKEDIAGLPASAPASSDRSVFSREFRLKM